MTDRRELAGQKALDNDDRSGGAVPAGDPGAVNAEPKHLIAAAPALYDAIRNSDDAHWTTAMRAAMAKAEGRR